jgi:hypothetical protein
MNPIDIIKSAASPWLKQIQIGIAVALLVGTAWGVHKLDKDHYEGIMAKQQVEWQQAAAKESRDFIDRMIKAEGERNENAAIVDHLGDYIAGLQPTVIRIPAPRSCEKQTSKSADDASWLAVRRLEGYTCQSKDDTNAIDKLLKRCGILNIDTIKLNNSF